MKISHIVQQLVSHSPKSIEVLVTEMNEMDALVRPDAPKRGVQVMRNKLNPNSTSHFLTVQEFEMLVTLLGGELAIARYFAQQKNAVVVELPEVNESDMALLDLFMASMIELGNLSKSFQESYADGVINQQELIAIKKVTSTVIAKLLEFQAAVERVSI